MNFLKRIKTLWTGFWGTLLGETESRHQNLVNEGLMQSQKKQLTRLKEAMTQLIYQRKRVEHRLETVNKECTQYQTDLEQAAINDKDEVALQAMERLENLQEEQEFLNNQLTLLKTDILEAKKSESALVQAISESRHKLNCLTSRKNALVARNQIRTQINGVTSGDTLDQSIFSTIQEQIHKLEADNELLSRSEDNLNSQIQTFRIQRKNSERRLSLTALKAELNSRLLPEPKKQFQRV